MAAQMLVFQSKSNVLFIMFNYGYVLMFVCIYTFPCVREHICDCVRVCTSVFVLLVRMYLYGFMCVCDCLTTPHT